MKPSKGYDLVEGLTVLPEESVGNCEVRWLTRRPGSASLPLSYQEHLSLRR
jgi:hypothetical protein